MKSNSFFAELKRRHVYKVAVAYAIVGWLVMQVAATVVPVLHLSDAITTAVVVLVILGFPIALIIAWAFELTPEGIKRTEEIEPPESRGRGWIYVAMIAAALSLGLFFLGRFTVSNKQMESSTVSSKSIAVLPFENLSEEKSNAYFAEGIQDEILTRLSKIGTLKVISRTSTAHYASSPQNLPEIAKQLGVANVLEGSVQKVNDAARINVQLIRAATDDHLWAESYDRKLTDIFGVEAEVAQNIASTLNAKLTGAEQEMLAQRPTTNPEAYDAYLRGSVQIRTDNPETAEAAVQSFQKAVRLDPQFALAWALLSKTSSLLFFTAEATPAHRADAEKALAEAIRLQPQLPETQLARAYFLYWVQNDKKSAREMLQQLRPLWPNNAEIPEALGYISARLGDWPASLNYSDQAIELSPRDHFMRFGAIDTRIASRDFLGALKRLDDALQIWPGDPEFLGLKAVAFQSLGRLDDAQSIVSGLRPGDQDQSAIGAIWQQAKLRRDAATALEFFRALSKRAENGSAYWALWNSLLFARLQEIAGDTTGARSSFARICERAQAALQEQPDNARILEFLARALAGVGERDAALKTIDQASSLTTQDARTHPNMEEERARILARFGAKDEAIAILQKLVTISYDGPITPALLRLDPDFDPLRGDPRFQQLCEEKQHRDGG
jgi:TolB-like protein/Flp pilus assembly protein TadD